MDVHQQAHGAVRWWSTARVSAALVSVMLLAGTGSAAAAVQPTGQDPLGTDLVTVIVEGRPDAAAAQVERLGGVVDRRLTVLDGLLARMPQAGIPALAGLDGVHRVTADTTLLPMAELWGDDTTNEDEQASLATGAWQADHDLGSTHITARATGAENAWARNDPNSAHKLTGHGVGVALIDTGVTPVEGLSAPGKVVNGPDLSLDSQTANTRYLDAYGHGTHLAGIIAGRDSTTPVGAENDKQFFVGIAPDARILNVKVGGSDGAVDVSQVIAGIDWVVTHRDTYGIRVLNLSYGTDSTQSSELDPLAHAVENAWRAGIVVVVAAGNDGESGPRPLTMPAIDPFVIAVGSSDHRGSDNRDNHRVGAWTNPGTDERRPDLLAPGKSVVSLRVPGSRADVGHPEGLVYGDAAARFFRATGTSQSAAVVSGAAALLLQRNPGLTPDQVKGVLVANADPLRYETSPVQGAGVLDVKGSVEQLESGHVPAYVQNAPVSGGTGSLDAARGGSYVVDPDSGVELRGEQDIFGIAWAPEAWAAASSNHTAWTGGTWRGAAWTGDASSGGSWPAVTWSGSSWSGAAWADRQWLRVSWSSDDWSRVSWSGDDWSRVSWSGGDWSRVSWSGYGH